ncbi:uncharacterized protein LOC118186438 [Stegodyphus dumicola]|uniref:uncharacterized protein LOC118186438 n=1 Tax=Stegodyphus dumicola TaxID=202533 RepID=UPI0015ABA7A7|nr:uncharacterized protein LOC118186438 [Stegodyphus dumicola]
MTWKISNSLAGTRTWTLCWKVCSQRRSRVILRRHLVHRNQRSQDGEFLKMSDGEIDIRLLALKRQQKRKKGQSNGLEHQVLEPAVNSYGRVRSGLSAYETTPLKTYNPPSSPANDRKHSGNLLFDEETRIGRMHVPPVVQCECNGLETYALISTSDPVSTISIDLVRKLRLLDQVIPEPMNAHGLFSLHGLDVKGRVKYIDLTLGSWQQVAQFNIVEHYICDVTLGTDFLRKTQSLNDRLSFSLRSHDRSTKTRRVVLTAGFT